MGCPAGFLLLTLGPGPKPLESLLPAALGHARKSPGFSNNPSIQEQIALNRH